MANPSVTFSRVKKINPENISDAEDLLATEEPLEIRLSYGPLNDRHQKSISVTMRTPGNDFELALGFLFSEGIIRDQKDVLQIKYCTDFSRSENIVKVELMTGLDVDLKKLERHFYTSSSCGVCGKASIEALNTISKFKDNGSEFTIDQEVFMDLSEKLRAKQNVFEYTGGLHAAALFNTDGEIIFIREDVGRHNALDKLIGAAFSSGQLPLNRHVVLLSGRSSFELIQKCVMAGVNLVAAIGAPSSLAVETAKKFNVTLIGFLRDNRFNIYSGEERINMTRKKSASLAGI